MVRNCLTHTFGRLIGLTKEMFERRIVHVERNTVGYGQTCDNVCDNLEDKYL